MRGGGGGWMKRVGYPEGLTARGISGYHLTKKQRKGEDVGPAQQLGMTHSYYRSHSHPVKHKRYLNGGFYQVSSSTPRSRSCAIFESVIPSEDGHGFANQR